MSEASKKIPSPEEHARQLAWFDEYTARLNARPRDLPLRCPCCGCKTLSKRTAFEICEVCFWEDDGQDDGDVDENRGGPNGSLSLAEARANYLRFGACEEKMIENVRPPRPDELSEQNHA
jgi:Cysteine-rich CPCC